MIGGNDRGQSWLVPIFLSVTEIGRDGRVICSILNSTESDNSNRRKNADHDNDYEKFHDSKPILCAKNVRACLIVYHITALIYRV